MGEPRGHQVTEGWGTSDPETTGDPVTAPLATLPRDEWGLPVLDIYLAYLEGYEVGVVDGREQGREHVLADIDASCREAVRLGRENIGVHAARQREGWGV
ncbi:hypothetical protein [Ornithinicoccus halotolerans]|uniref:hypothetical protein n=1 Tax=Ornithinicoccus halotolerans TaxID=1748220 RepID=UPI001294CE16|nr:hypothetical protein [Ornithinicoccus halotolerans]